jgi:hypothetical protein
MRLNLKVLLLVCFVFAVSFTHALPLNKSGPEKQMKSQHSLVVTLDGVVVTVSPADFLLKKTAENVCVLSATDIAPPTGEIKAVTKTVEIPGLFSEYGKSLRDALPISRAVAHAPPENKSTGPG